MNNEALLADMLNEVITTLKETWQYAKDREDLFDKLDSGSLTLPQDRAKVLRARRHVQRYKKARDYLLSPEFALVAEVLDLPPALILRELEPYLYLDADRILGKSEHLV